MARPTDWHIVDLDSDPTPGDPYRVKELGGRLRGLGDDADRAGRDVRGLLGDHAAMNWIGEAGDAFREHVGKFPGQLDKVATSHHMCADALTAYGDALDGAQSQADRALTQARPLFDQVQNLHNQLAAANAHYAATARGVTDAQSAANSANVDPNAVKNAIQAKTDAQNAVSSLNSQLSGPEAQLAALKKLAQDAKHLRENAENEAERKINAATDAGIPPDSFWHKLGDLCAALWHGLVIIAQVVSLIGGIILLIVGGPLWLIIAVVVAGLIILADTLYKYSQGKASLWDVGLALLSCIPTTKGITTIAGIKDAFEAGGLIGVGGHLLVSGWTAVKGMATTVKNGVGWISAFLSDGSKAADAADVAKGVDFTKNETNFDFNMVTNPGPLDPSVATNFAGGKYNMYMLQQDTVFYRGGTADKPLGQWFTAEPPTSVAQVRIDSAVKPQWIDPKTGAWGGVSPIDAAHSVKIPAGTVIYKGPVGYQGGIYLGGGADQIFIPKPWDIPGVEPLTTEPLK